MRKFLIALAIIFIVTTGSVIVAHRGAAAPDDSKVFEVISDKSVKFSFVIPNLPEFASTTTVAPSSKIEVIKKPKPSPKLPESPQWTASVGGVNAFLECVGKYESGSNYASHTANGSGGKYGFLTSTFQRGGWAARYGVTYPYQATPAQQDEMAMELYASSGSRPWSTRNRCGG